MAATRLPTGRARVGRSDACDLVVPDVAVSRVHVELLHGPMGWTAQDRSTHGTLLNGAPLLGVAPLKDQDLLGVGPFGLRFLAADQVPAARTATRQIGVSAAQLRSSWAGLEGEGLTLVVQEGPDKGRRELLRHLEQGVGGAGSLIALRDLSLLPDHVRLRVVRGRPLLLPGAGACFLNGERVVEPTPMWLEDSLRMGDSVLSLQQGKAPMLPESLSFGEMVGAGERARRLFGELACFAMHDAPVLILGESGTGKELAARGLHSEGPRADGPFVALNCAALPRELVESELFGHERGAFSGAHQRHDGAFQRAHKGTLFLDELGELPLDMQPKLLRALESGEVRRVGGTVAQFPDVRVVAATNRDLAAQVHAGRFRQDLYFRLAVLVTRLPPLRERPEDLTALVQSLCARLGPDVRVQAGALALLAAHPFPGNVRELNNVLLRATVRGGPHIRAEHLLFDQTAFGAPPLEEDPEASERALVEQALRRCRGNRAAAARALGVPRSTLLYRLERYGLG